MTVAQTPAHCTVHTDFDSTHTECLQKIIHDVIAIVVVAAFPYDIRRLSADIDNN